MSKIETGGPAFPVNTSTAPDFDGITIRDYFAAKAMQALLIANGPAPVGGWATYAERTAYLIADAMLEARK